MAAVNAAERATLTEDTAPAGIAHIGVSYTVAGNFLPCLFIRFTRSYPRIRAELHELTRVTASDPRSQRQ
jgi:DNA-binding transcriptional LysR family regulator